MKKFAKFAAFFGALAFTLLFFVSCVINASTDDDDETSFSVWLEGGYWDYYLEEETRYSNSNYIQEGYLDSYCRVWEEGDGCVAKFRISGSNLKVTLFDGQSLNTGYYISVYGRKSYGGSYEIVGYVKVIKVNGKYKLNYYSYDPPSYDADKNFSVELTGSSYGYYLEESYISGNGYLQCGYLDDDCYIWGEKNNSSAASFSISGSILRITIFQGYSLTTEKTIKVYSRSYFGQNYQVVGCVKVTKVFEQYELQYIKYN